MPFDPTAAMFYPSVSQPIMVPHLAGGNVTFVAPPVVPTVNTIIASTAIQVPGFTGKYVANVTTGLGNVLLATGPGVLNSVFFQTASAANAIITIFDQNLVKNSTRMIGYFAGSTAIGTFQRYDIPFEYGIMINQAVSTTKLTIVYTV